FTHTISAQGDDASDTSITAPGSYYRFGFQGSTSSHTDQRFGNDQSFTLGGWTQVYRDWTYNGVDYGQIESQTSSQQSGRWDFYAYERGTQSCSYLCGSYDQNADQGAVSWHIDEANTWTHGLDFSGSQTGYSLTDAKIYITYNFHSGDWDDSDNRYAVYVRYYKDGVASGWHLIHSHAGSIGSDGQASGTASWDIDSAVDGSGPSTTWKLSFRVECRAYSSGYNDPEELECDITSMYMRIDYQVAEEFNDGTYCRIQSSSFNYEKDTIQGNLTYRYRLPQEWSNTGANTRARLRIWMSSSAQSGGGSRTIYDQPLSAFTANGVFNTRSLDITADLGYSGQVVSFYFRFDVYWDISGTGQWGPMTTSLLYFDFDWITLNFDANVRPDEAGLYLINNGDGAEYTINGGYGLGVVDWTKSWGAGTSPTFDLKINDTWFTGSVASYVTQATVDIGYTDLNMTESCTLAPATSFYSISANATTATWYLSYTSCSKNDDSRTDGTEVITISGLPSDYQGSSISPNNHGETVDPSAPAGNIRIKGSHSSTSYTVTATAPNYLFNHLNNIRCMENSSGVFQDTSVVYPTNWTSIRINADAAGYANLTIVNASRVGIEATWGFGIEYQELLQTSPQINSTPWQIPLDSIPGMWTIILAWNNSLNSANLDQVGLVSIPLNVRRRTYVTNIMFNQENSTLVGDGTDPNNPANVTLDGDPLYINITWFDKHWSTPVTYFQKANITIDADYEPYNDKPPYTTKEFEMIRDGGTFYIKIDQEDYGIPAGQLGGFSAGWCYTGSHDFTIELYSDSTDINGTTDTYILHGSFYVVVDIQIEAWEPSALPSIDEYFQGEDFRPTLVVRDISHNQDISNTSADYQGLVKVNWTLVFGDNSTEQQEIISNWNTRTNGSLTQVVGGVFQDSLTIDPACVATDDLSPFWYEQYYYFNFSVYIAKNTTIDWTFEQVYYMNESASDQERMVNTPYEKPKWVKIAVTESVLTLGTAAKVSTARDPTEKTSLDVYWYDWNNDILTMYVRYYSSVDNSTESETGLVSGTGFVNSTYYNTTISQREGNVSCLRATFSKRGAEGDVYIESEASGALWTTDQWEEAIPYRWTGDTGDHYSLVPELDTSTGYFTGNLTQWDANNNYTWGWYYRNFTIHEALTGDYFIRITASKLEKYWYNTTEIGGADKYKFMSARKDVIVTVEPNLVVLTQKDGGNLIPELPTQSTYYWNETLTLNLTAWDAINNGTVTPEHPNGVWKVPNFALYFNLINRQDPLNPINESINIPEVGSGIYVFEYDTYPLDGELPYRFKITGNLQNYTIDDDGSLPVVEQMEIDFYLNERPTTLLGVSIQGVMTGVEKLSDIQTINELLPLDIGRTETYYIPKDRLFIMSVRYADDTRNITQPTQSINQSINDAITYVNVTQGGAPALPGQTWEDYLAENFDGIYNYTINTTGLLVGESYRISCYANKSLTGANNYQVWGMVVADQAYFDLEIKPIPVVVEPVNTPVVTQGSMLYVMLHVYDPTASGNFPRELPGAIVTYEIRGPGINMVVPIQGYMIEVSPGLYITGLETWTSLFAFNVPGTYIFEARLTGFQKTFDPDGSYGTYLEYDTAALLSSQGTQLILYVNSAGPFGPLSMSTYLGLIGAVVIAGSYMTYESIRILRVPYPLRMIEDTTKKIKRRRKTHAGIMKSREQQIVEEAETKLSMLGVKLEPISPKKLPPPITKTLKKKEAEKELPTLTEEQIKAELDAIPDLSAEEKMLFLKEIKGLSPSDQREFIAGLKGEPKEEKPKKE
ncbi:MAG: hypothetical protein ACTSR3_09180, partial [Candidatus Helarchaeota archaeon]